MASETGITNRPFGRRGFTMVELIVVVAIVGMLSTLTIVAVNGALKKARDVKRKADLAQLGRLLTSGCRVPDSGPGDFDFSVIVADLKAKSPQFAQMIGRVPRDPRGNDTDTRYRYVVSADGTKCAVYANLENANEPVSLSGLNAPTPGGGTGVLQNASSGPNGTDRYLQVSN